MVSVKSDTGLIRKYNEDSFDYLVTDEYEIYIVADGMGGHNAGDVASKCAVNNITSFIKENYGEYQKKETILVNAIKYANKIIYKNSLENNRLQGMGTTIVALFKNNDFLQIANVGDSVAFGIKDHKLKKITIDHSLVQELINIGSITEEEGRVHPKKNIITRAVGTNINLEVDIFTIDKDSYDGFLLCTDGLTNELNKWEIEKILSESQLNTNVSETLIDMAKKKGGKDNITVLIVGGEV